MSQNGGSRVCGVPTLAQRTLHINRSAVHEKACKEFSFHLSVERLRAIFEEFLRLDLLVQVLLEANSPRRIVALETQSLWRRLLLSADAIPSSHRAGSVHACGSEGQASRTLKIITKLEVTFVLGQEEWSTTNASLLKPVGHGAFHRISFPCIIVNPEMTLPPVNASLHDGFHGTLPCLKSLMIASARATGNLYGPLDALMHIIDESSTKLESLYLENVNKDFILRTSRKALWTRLIRVTIRNDFDSLETSHFSLPPDLEIFSFSGKLVATPAPFTAHLDSALGPLIEFPELKWLRVSLISMGALARLHLPKLHKMAIDCVQGNYPPPAPPPGTLHLPALKVLVPGIVTKLETTFILGPKESDKPNPNPEIGRDAERQPIFIPSYLSEEWKEPDFWGRWNQKRPPNLHESIGDVVGSRAYPTIRNLCLVFSTEAAPSFANSCLHVNFVPYLARLGSLLVPGVPVVKLLIISADSIHASLPCLKYPYRKNDGEDWLLRASIQYLSPRLIQTAANRIGPSSITQDRSSHMHVFGPPITLSRRVAIPGLAHIDATCGIIILAPKLDWLLFGCIALGNFGNPGFAGSQGLVIDCVQGTQARLTPPLGAFPLSAIKALQTAPVNPGIVRFNSLQLDRALAILAPNPERADTVLKPVTGERGMRVKPRHLMLVGPLHDAHLSHALKLLSENLAGLELDSLILSMKNGPLCLNMPPVNLPEEPTQPADDPAPKLDANEVEGFQPAMVNIPQFLHNDHVEPISSMVGIGVVEASVATSVDHSTVVNAAEVPNLSGQVLILQRKAVFVGTYSKVYVGMLGVHKVAIKMLRLVKSRRATKRKFRRELFISWHLRHPNILPLYGYSEYDDGEDMSYALVLKWADQGNAAQYIYSRNLSWNQCTKLVHNVADGLRYLHAFNPPIIHADLKPLNVLIDNDGVAQIGDFGISRLMEDGVDTGMTTTTPHFGTVRFLAPELVDPGKAVPSRPTDIWALGCVAYELIYRVRPYADIHISWRISQAIDEGVPPAERPMHSGEDIPVLWSLLELCWSTDPAMRPSAEDFFQTFDQNRNLITNSLRTIYGDLAKPMDDFGSTPLTTTGE